jgi:hypothetical protein
MKIDPDKYYTTEEVAQIWNLVDANGNYKNGAVTIRRKINRKEINAINIGTTQHPHYRILGRELLRYEREHQTK